MRKEENLHAYQEAFKKNKNIQCPIVPYNTDPAWHLYIIRYIGDDIEWRIRTCIPRENNIFSQVHYIPIHLQPWYKGKYKK